MFNGISQTEINELGGCGRIHCKIPDRTEGNQFPGCNLKPVSLTWYFGSKWSISGNKCTCWNFLYTSSALFSIKKNHQTKDHWRCSKFPTVKTRIIQSVHPPGVQFLRLTLLFNSTCYIISMVGWMSNTLRNTWKKSLYGIFQATVQYWVRGLRKTCQYSW
jgi:hypothetical protein